MLWRGEREEEGELATTSLDIECHLQFLFGSPSTELSDFRQSARSGNERECKHVPRVMTSLLMSSPPISILHRLFRSRYSNSRDVVASSPSFSRPAAKAPRIACFQATETKQNKQTNKKAPRRTLLLGSFVSFVLTVPAERPQNCLYSRALVLHFRPAIIQS